MFYGSKGLLFHCQAENIGHAIEQCENAYPGDSIICAHMGKLDMTPVYAWDSPQYGGENEEAGEEFLLEVTDRRRSSGQIRLDCQSSDGDTDNLMGLMMEISRLPGSKDDTQCVHLSFDNDNSAMSIYKQGDTYILYPEAGVTLRETRLPNGDAGYILE